MKYENTDRIYFIIIHTKTFMTLNTQQVLLFPNLFKIAQKELFVVVSGGTLSNYMKL